MSRELCYSFQQICTHISLTMNLKLFPFFIRTSRCILNKKQHSHNQMNNRREDQVHCLESKKRIKSKERKMFIVDIEIVTD